MSGKKKERPLSMKDISRMAGVSVATVSRVINQNGRFSEETRKRVEKIIAQHHYVPNMAAKGLKTRRSNFIAIVVPDITNEFFAKIVVGIQESLLKEGYMALVCNTGEDEQTQMKYNMLLGAVQLSGLIFISGQTAFMEKKMEELPAIYIDRQPSNFGGGNSLVVESDNYGGAGMAVQELYDKGCRRIACMYSSQKISTHRQRYEGYRDGLESHDIAPDEKLRLQVGEVSFSAGKQCTKKLLESGTAVDGIFCATDWLALGALEAIAEQGLRVPEDIKVIGFDDISAARLAAKPLTTVRQQIDALSAVATRELMALIQGNPVRASRMEIPVSLVRRDTT